MIMVNAYTIIIVHACTLIIVHACTMIVVHACTMIIVHACTMIIVHACTMIIVHACTMIIPMPRHVHLGKLRVCSYVNEWTVKRGMGKHVANREVPYATRTLEDVPSVGSCTCVGEE